jgi:spore germination protein GerM
MKRILIIIVLFVLLGFIGFIVFQRDKSVLSEPETMTVKVFFNNSLLDPEYSCYKVFPVEREVVKTQGVARVALEQLLQGPSQEEKEQGFYTSLSQGIMIQSLSVVEGVAKVDFNDQLEFQVGGSCLVSAIRAQITQTLKQFSTVKEVIISVNGRVEDILQP